ncbi:hypothetical protein NDI47_01150 [Microcoleus vaginatus GB1-A2]|nr:hypothetical protein [Microcoleus sp. FACHB-61]
MCLKEARRKKEEGRSKKQEARRREEDGRGKKQEARKKTLSFYLISAV